MKNSFSRIRFLDPTFPDLRTVLRKYNATKQAKAARAYNSACEMWSLLGKLNRR